MVDAEYFSQKLERVPLFAALTQAQRETLAKGLQGEVGSAGHCFVNQGDWASDFYVLIHGDVATTRVSEHHGEERLETLSAIDWFGEMSILSLLPQPVTVTAVNDCTVIRIEPGLFKFLYKDNAEFRKIIDAKYTQRGLAFHLGVAPLFRDLTREQRHRLRDHVEFQIIDKGQQIAAEGDSADALYLVRSGVIKSVRKREDGGEQIIACYAKNSSFGERSFASDPAQKAWPGSYVAMSRSELLKITPRALNDSLGRETSRDVTQMATAIISAEQGLDPGDVPIPKDGGATDPTSLEILGTKQSIKGGYALAIDMSKCIRCNSCVESCVAVHEDRVPRLSKKGSRVTLTDGSQQHEYTLATSCYSCDVPECMLSCEFGAIRRDMQGLVQIVEDNCVGCGRCAEMCPYGVIRMARPATNPKAGVDRMSFWELIPFLGPVLTRKKAELKESQAPTAQQQRSTFRGNIPVMGKAIKCDRCQGLPFEACVYNCPTQAISRRNPAELIAQKGT